MVHISLLATTRLVPSNAAVFFPIAFTVPSLAPPLCHLATPSHVHTPKSLYADTPQSLLVSSADTGRLQHKLICTYGKGSRIEYGGCFRELELGALRSSVKDRTPAVVKVKVIAKRVTDYCASDGFYSTCSKRRQPYALVVSGPLLARCFPLAACAAHADAVCE